MIKKTTPKKSTPKKGGPRVAAAAASVRAAPVSKGYSQSSSPPHYSGSSDGTIRIKKKEFVRTLTNGASTDFMITEPCANEPGLDLNPANVLLFPWLAGIADRYERYRFHSITIELLPAQATSTAGRLYAAVDYDYDDQVPKTKSEVLAYRTAREGPVWDRLVMSLDSGQLHPDNQWKYTSSNTRRNYVEPRTSYCGYILVALEATANCKFDLWISYDVSLTSPEPQVQGQYATIAAHAEYTTIPQQNVGTTDFGNSVYGELIRDAVNAVGSALVQRVCNNGEVPRLVNGLFPGTIYPADPTHCYDIAGTGGKGTITWQAIFSVLGQTVNQLITTYLPRIGYLAYDSKGAFVGYSTDDTYNTGTPGGVIPNKDNAWATANIPARVTATSAINSILSAFPTARYIVPWLLLGATQSGANGARFTSGYKLTI